MDSNPVFFDVTRVAIPLYVLGILIELVAIRYWQRKGEFETRDAFTSLLMGRAMLQRVCCSASFP